MVTISATDVIVNEDLWDLVLKHDKRAIDELRGRVHGLTCYEHAVPIYEGETTVSLSSMVDAGIIESITINAVQKA